MPLHETGTPGTSEDTHHSLVVGTLRVPYGSKLTARGACLLLVNATRLFALQNHARPFRHPVFVVQKFAARRRSRWFPAIALIVAAVASPCAAQQAERARELQKMHREALELQKQFQE